MLDGREDKEVFVGDSAGPEQFVGFFEDDGTVAYLYVSDRKSKQIIRHLKVYDTVRSPRPSEEDISVIWSKDNSKCGVIIYGGLRGIIDLASGRDGRVKLLGPDSPPILEPSWTAGFVL